MLADITTALLKTRDYQPAIAMLEGIFDAKHVAVAPGSIPADENMGDADKE